MGGLSTLLKSNMTNEPNKVIQRLFLFLKEANELLVLQATFTCT